jgi:hypothetical protein
MDADKLPARHKGRRVGNLPVILLDVQEKKAMKQGQRTA